MTEIRALAASAAGEKLKPFTFDPGPLADDQVDIDVQYCGVCHSDLSMWNNEFHSTRYPFVFDMRPSALCPPWGRTPNW